METRQAEIPAVAPKMDGQADAAMVASRLRSLRAYATPRFSQLQTARHDACSALPVQESIGIRR